MSQKDSLTIHNFEIPDLGNVLGCKIADILSASNELASIFPTHFKPNSNQKAVFEIIENSEIPEDQTLHLLVYGGVGSGKTWGALGYALDKALAHPGVMVLGVRQTSMDIKKSIYTESIQFLERYGVPFKKNDTDTNIVLPNSSNLWMKSDKALVKPGRGKSDSLGSVALSVVVLEEADSISQTLADTIPSRMRQRIPGFRKVIFYVCNPPSENHWLWKLFMVDNDPEDPKSPYRAIHCPMEGNMEYLDEGYIETVEKAYEKRPGMYRRLRLGLFAPDHAGDPIFQNTFIREVHAPERKHPLYKDVNHNGGGWNPRYQMWRGWDAGWNGNVMTVMQDDLDRRQIRIFKAAIEQNVMFNDFAKHFVNWCNRIFPDAYWRDICDPAFVQRDAKAEKSYLEILTSVTGRRPDYLRTNVAYGLNIIDEQLKIMARKENRVGEELVKPHVLICSIECATLCDALESGYCNKKDSVKKGMDPFKDGYYDHLVDGLRYPFTLLRPPNGGKVPSLSNMERDNWKMDDGLMLVDPMEVNRYGTPTRKTTGQVFQTGGRKYGNSNSGGFGRRMK